MIGIFARLMRHTVIESVSTQSAGKESFQSDKEPRDVKDEGQRTDTETFERMSSLRYEVARLRQEEDLSNRVGSFA